MSIDEILLKTAVMQVYDLTGNWSTEQLVQLISNMSEFKQRIVFDYLDNKVLTIK